MANKPFLLRPAGKDYLWGGRRLIDDFEKNIDMSPLAETWECSTHPDGLSFVASGEYEGMSLADVLNMHPEYLGNRYNGQDAGVDCAGRVDLPILIKLIDADKDLSVQVHPTDEYAMEHESGQLGKTEMWYVLDAMPDSKLVYGFRRDTDEGTLRAALQNGTFMRQLQQIPVKKDDVFYIESGTVHAIGAGTLVAEIQENSNLTYRLYDYDRVDKNGCKRELHIDKAIDVANMNKASEPRQPLRVLQYRPGVASELLGRCKYFEVYRMLVNTERKQLVTYQADALSYRVLLCIGGCGTISFSDSILNIYKGDCIFVPAESEEIRIHGAVQFLDVRG